MTLIMFIDIRFDHKKLYNEWKKKSDNPMKDALFDLDVDEIYSCFKWIKTLT